MASVAAPESFRDRMTVTIRPRGGWRIAQYPAIGRDDLLLGNRPTGIATLLERTSRYTQLVALPNGH